MPISSDCIDKPSSFNTPAFLQALKYTLVLLGIDQATGAFDIVNRVISHGQFALYCPALFTETLIDVCYRRRFHIFCRSLAVFDFQFLHFPIFQVRTLSSSYPLDVHRFSYWFKKLFDNISRM